MRLLFFTDSHIRGTNPRNRKDDFLQTLKNKFNEIKGLSEEFKVDYIIHGGDWFDRPDISPSIVREFAIILQKFTRPIYTIAGNHDVYGHNPSTLERTMLGLIEGIGIIKLLNYQEKTILHKGNIKLQLTGSHYNFDIDGDEFKKYYIVEKDPDVDFAINVVHGMLVEKPFFEGMRYTLIEDIKDTSADITLAGHYHTGFGIKKIGKKYFVNPGGIARITNSLTEINRSVDVALITLEQEINIELIPLKSALPGYEVLDRAELEKSVERNYKLQHFYKNIVTSGNYEKLDLNKIIEEIASNENLNIEVKNEAIRRIGIAVEAGDKLW